MLTDLTIESLGKLDNGSVGALINANLASALKDIDDRGTDGKVRKVVIEVTLQQLPSDRVTVEVQATSKLPKYRSEETVGNLRMAGKDNVKLVFNDSSPENPDQRTIDELGGEFPNEE